MSASSESPSAGGHAGGKNEPPRIEKKQGFPYEGDLVLCTITTVYPTSAFASLDEYENLEGMIPIGEISSSWVKNIRSIVKEGKSTVCLVMAVNPDRRHINLSLKRVSESDKKQKFEQVKRGKKTQKMIEQVRETLSGKLPDDLGELLEKEFAEVYFAFEAAAKDGKAALIEKGIPEKIASAFEAAGKENIVFQDIELKASVELSSFEGDGVEQVKKILSIAERAGAKVSYISAPKYHISLVGKDFKSIERKLREIAEEMSKFGKKARFDFALIKDGNREEEVKV